MEDIIINWQIRWIGKHNGRIISGVLPKYNSKLALGKLQILDISNVILLPNLRIIDNLIAAQPLITSTKFLQILTNAIVNEKDLLEAITSIQATIKHKEFSAVLLDMAEYISYGNSFSTAICRHEKYFDKILVSQITIGEKTGNISHNLNRILKQRTQKIAAIKTLKKNLTYPLLLLLIASAILLAFIMLVMPTIYDATANLELSKSQNLTKTIKLASALEYWLPIYTKAIIIVLLCYLIYPKTHRNSISDNTVKYYLHKACYYTPVIHKFYHLAFIDFFSSNLAMLKKSNIDITSSFDTLTSLEQNLYLKEKLQTAKNLVVKGSKLSEALVETSLFPNDFITELKSAEFTNTVNNVLEQLAKHYEKDLEDKVSSYCKLIEPSIIIIVACIIGSILISVYVPLLSIAEII